MSGNASQMAEAGRDPRTGVFGAQLSSGEVNGKIVARLPGSAARYVLLDDGSGNCIVLLVGDPDIVDPGRRNTGTGSGAMTADQIARICRDDAQAVARKLRALNEHNRKVWRK